MPQRMDLSSAMIVATAPSIFSVDFSLSGLMFPAGSVRMKMLSIIQRRTGCPPWAMRCSSTSFISSFVGGDIHILEALSERNDREAHALKILHHLYSAPTVEGNLPDVEAFAQAFDELFDVAIVNNIAFRGL